MLCVAVWPRDTVVASVTCDSDQAATVTDSPTETGLDLDTGHRGDTNHGHEYRGVEV